MHTDYKELKEYLLDAIAGDARGVLNAIGGRDADEVDDEEVLEYCHSLAVSMTTLETVAMVGRLVPWFLEDVRERSLDRPNVMSVTCPACGVSNSIAGGSKKL